MRCRHTKTSFIRSSYLREGGRETAWHLLPPSRSYVSHAESNRKAIMCPYAESISLWHRIMPTDLFMGNYSPSRICACRPGG